MQKSVLAQVIGIGSATASKTSNVGKPTGSVDLGLGAGFAMVAAGAAFF